MDVAVTGVTEAGNEQLMTALQIANQLEQRRHAAARHDDVVVDLLGLEGAQRVRQLASRLPDRVALFGAGGAPHLGSASGATGVENQRRFFLDAGGHAVHLDDQHRAGAARRQRPADMALDGAERHRDR